MQRIKLTTEKALDKDKSLTERICTLFREQGITSVSIITALSMTIFSGSSPAKDKESLKKWLNMPSKDLLVRLFKHFLLWWEELLQAFSAIVGRVVGAILSFHGKALGFLADLTWTLILLQGLLGYG